MAGTPVLVHADVQRYALHSLHWRRPRGTVARGDARSLRFQRSRSVSWSHAVSRAIMSARAIDGCKSSCLGNTIAFPWTRERVTFVCWNCRFALFKRFYCFRHLWILPGKLSTRSFSLMRLNASKIIVCLRTLNLDSERETILPFAMARHTETHGNFPSFEGLQDEH